MGKFTLFNQDADQGVQKDMDFIVKSLREKIPGVLGIYLTGGFSRGEGPIKKINGKWFPYNDYDIQIISKFKISKKEIDRISVDISRKLGYRGIINFYPFKKEDQKLKDNFYIDLKCNTFAELKRMLPRIRNYELRNESLILWNKGNRDYRKLIPDYDLEKIPLGEGAKLLIDRMSQMIEYYSTEDKHDKEFLTYIIQQAYAACCTSLLQLSGKYKIGYKRAMKIFKENYKKDFPELYEKIPDLHLKIEEFINWKSNPIKLPNKDVREEWFIAKKNILEVSFYFFSRFLNKKIKTIDDLAKAVLNMEGEFYGPFLREIIKNKVKVDIGRALFLLLPFVRIILRKKYLQRLKEMKIDNFRLNTDKSPDLVILCSLVYLIKGIHEGGVDEKMLERGREILSKVYPCEGKVENSKLYMHWEKLSLDYTNAYIAFYMQKI